MTAAALILLLVVQLSRILASGLLIQSKACESNHISYSSDGGQQMLYIDGKLVNSDSFCRLLKLYQESHCFLPTNVRDFVCGMDGSIDAFSPETEKIVLHPVLGRKFLHPVVREDTIGHTLGKSSQAIKDEDAEKSSLNPKMLVMAIPGILVLCGCLLCPCFRAQKRGVLGKDPNSMDSVSSMEMNSTSERILASPRVPPSPSRFSMSPKLNRVGSVHLNMDQISRATHNFSPSLQIGEGGFGTVYKAKLEDGQVVAIKRAKKEHFDNLRTEFSSEVELLAKIDHRSLVKLLGYINRGNERLIIIEYVPNGTLREHLDGQRGKILDFNQRLEISIDVAHALTYLHLYAEKQIIHRDVKSSNILLTESMRAKVADFGFARIGDTDSDKTHISTKVKGTIGYLDPEYMKTFKLTAKSDVYSFGVLLLEILTGRRPVELKRSPEERITLRWAFKNFNERNVEAMLDPLMTEAVDNEILMKMFDLAINCAAPIRADRPNMKTVGEHLWAIRMDYIRRGRGE